jgi:hypothetical protein
VPDVLAEGRVPRSPPPRRPPGRCPLVELAEARLAIANQAQAVFAATAPLRLAGGCALLRRAGRAWWIERDVQRQRTAQQRAAWVAAPARAARGWKAAGRAELQRWQPELVPTYQPSWRVYRQTPPGAAAPAARGTRLVAEAANQRRTRRSVLGRRPRSRR